MLPYLPALKPGEMVDKTKWHSSLTFQMFTESNKAFMKFTSKVKSGVMHARLIWTGVLPGQVRGERALKVSQ